jgi:hypothetical protein
MPETGQPPIRVYREHDMWHVDYDEGVTQTFASREETESAAAEAQAWRQEAIHRSDRGAPLLRGLARACSSARLAVPCDSDKLLV